jgi:alanyl-tRNA synthetase
VLTSAEIRQSFLDHFESQGHKIVPSMSLVPGGDETLLFTNSGMVQFKDVFLGTGTRSYSRVADSQKCMRVAGKHNDLDDVGRNNTHHTFFEMLGNWSFGDYYKKEAIEWAWQLLTDSWELPKDKIWATCFEDELGEIPRDDEAAENWARQPGFDGSHILFFGREENFWEMADTGPSGPDSEVHLDIGAEHCTKQDVAGHECHVNGNCGRFLELWNLVFIQYNRTGPTKLDPLPKKHVDTGMGFERLVSVLQGTYSNYKTDLFAPIIEATRRLAGHSDEQVEQYWTPYRVIADHARAAAFLIGDGVVPGNLGRNYVTRMIIRRASLFGGKLGFDEPFLAEIAGSVIAHYGEAYPELEQNQGAIAELITDEERRFARTIEGGISRLNERLEALEADGQRILPGDWAFDLYATYGLPFEITRDLARERGSDTDEAGFFEAMDRHRELSVGATDPLSGGADFAELTVRYQELLKELRDTGKLGPEGVRYDPYGGLEVEGPILALLREAQVVDHPNPGEPVAVVLAETPFYVEAGGQVSDTGSIVSASDPHWEVEVQDTRQPVNGLVIHLGVVNSGNPKVGDASIAAVHAPRRAEIVRNHTATHLLHAALREVLGSHARQAGSLVAPDRLRFDFTHSDALSAAEIEQIEQRVNENILGNYPLIIQYEPREAAIKQGAMALFGETYSDTVRTIAIGDPNRFSYELCGGTHVQETGVIGTFLITSEASVAAGIRRIEAVTGNAALSLIHERFAALQEIGHQLSVAPGEIRRRLETVIHEREELARELAKLREELAVQQFAELTPEPVDGVPVLTGLIPGASEQSLRTLLDRFRSDHPTGVAVLATAIEDRPIIVAAITKDLVERGLHAGELVKTVAEQIGGGGGGKATMAQAGGKDASKLPKALSLVTSWVAERLS